MGRGKVIHPQSLHYLGGRGISYVRCGPITRVTGKLGGLNGSTQHELEVYFQESQRLKSFASVDPNGTPPCLGLMEYSRTDRFSRGSIVGSTDWMVLRRPSELAAVTGEVGNGTADVRPAGRAQARVVSSSTFCVRL